MWIGPRLAKMVYLLPLLMLAGGCAPEGGRENVRKASGKDLFEENCGPCHGTEGRGPSLDELQSLSPEALRAGIRNHPTAGQIPQRLTADTINSLIIYLEE